MAPHHWQVKAAFAARLGTIDAAAG